jgi:hypothetical protein
VTSNNWLSDPNPICPSCGVKATEHHAGPCLDEWVYREFIGKPLAPGAAAPPYSTSESGGPLDELLLSDRWPQDFIAVIDERGCIVGRKQTDHGASVTVRHIAMAGSLALAVCRAAARVAGRDGRSRLEIQWLVNAAPD